jgi:hypothetical protein
MKTRILICINQLYFDSAASQAFLLSEFKSSLADSTYCHFLTRLYCLINQPMTLTAIKDEQYIQSQHLSP